MNNFPFNQGGKEHFPVQEVAKALTVVGHQPGNQGGAAARVADDENRFFDFLEPQSRKENLVQEEKDRVD